MILKKILFIVVACGVSFVLNANPDHMGKGHDGHHDGHGMMEMIDTNKDGKISKDEWMAHFNEIDANKDGFLTQDEFDKHHDAMQEKRHEQMHKDMQKK